MKGRNGEMSIAKRARYYKPQAENKWATQRSTIRGKIQFGFPVTGKYSDNL